MAPSHFFCSASKVPRRDFGDQQGRFVRFVDSYMDRLTSKMEELYQVSSSRQHRPSCEIDVELVTAIPVITA